MSERQGHPFGMEVVALGLDLIGKRDEGVTVLGELTDEGPHVGVLVLGGAGRQLQSVELLLQNFADALRHDDPLHESDKDLDDDALDTHSTDRLLCSFLNGGCADGGLADLEKNRDRRQSDAGDI